MNENENDGLIWLHALSLANSVKDVDDAVLFSRFWRIWSKYIPADDASAPELLEFTESTRRAWRCVLEMNNQFQSQFSSQFSEKE